VVIRYRDIRACAAIFLGPFAVIVYVPPSLRPVGRSKRSRWNITDVV
jgi:hypothetical protein